MAPVISLRGVGRFYMAGEERIDAIKSIDLDIEAGELVAIIGASGSGKSTLMNILGCLDQPSSGSYAFKGRDISSFDADELAALRREHFGFIFQRYHLLGDLDAVENVEVPAIYAGTSAHQRRERAEDLLRLLGLQDRFGNRPSQLSGGQQQRVSVARALINGGEVILADEPTGALDSKSGEELITLIRQMNSDGHTIIIVTHDPEVAKQADRIIEIRDGMIISDQQVGTPHLATPFATDAGQSRRQNVILRQWTRATQAFRMALRAMSAHKMRTLLTMLGIIIGIASVVGVVALGQGSQQEVLERISAIGTNTISVQPGSGFGDRTAGRIHTLVPADAQALAGQDFADSVTPTVSSNGTIRHANSEATAQVTGVGVAYFQVNGRTISQGAVFTDSQIQDAAQVAVIDQSAADSIFSEGSNILGEVIMIGNVPVRVIGVAENASGFGPGRDSANVWLPYTTVMHRISGQNYLNGITVRVADDYDTDLAQTEIQTLLATRHGTTDFFLRNSNTIRETITSTSETLTLLITAIAVISLLVGGIGVMNIMLVSVTERTREIGVRMAVGARRSDIMLQFLIESVVVCMVGGALGIGLAFGAGWFVTTFAGTRLAYSAETIMLAVLCSTLIGVSFGFIPARSAARLNPVDALSRD